MYLLKKAALDCRTRSKNSSSRGSLAETSNVSCGIPTCLSPSDAVRGR